MSEIYYALNPWWEGKDFPVGISRPRYIDELSPKMKRRQIEVLTGSRRAGKTTILKQLIKQALKDVRIPANSATRSGHSGHPGAERRKTTSFNHMVADLAPVFA